MQEAVLREVVRDTRIAGQLAQEISHLRLVPANQFPERTSILGGYCPGDQFQVFAVAVGRTMVDQSSPAKRQITR